MEILFVSPTWTDDLGGFSRIAKARNSQPPLGILYLAAIAERRGHKIRVIDADVEDHTFESLVQHIMDNPPDLLGITATSPVFHKAEALGRELKKAGFKPPVLIGGEHFNIFKSAAFSDAFDFAFFGESDLSFEKFLQLREEGSEDYGSICGLIFRSGAEVVETKPNERIKDLDSLDFPALHLIRHNRYWMTFAKWKRRMYLPILATRGCPFKCVFCSEPLTNPYVRFRSPLNIVDEIEHWSRTLGITHFFFMDSNLTLKRDQIETVCNEIIRRKLNVTFEGWTRANLVDREILTLLKRAGLIRISYGIESGDPEILKIIRKEVSLDDMRRAFRLTKEVGIEVACSVMIGLPGETRASVMRTIRFVQSIPEVLYSNFSIANPYPGTQLLEWAQQGKHGIRLVVGKLSEYRRYDSSPITVNDLSQDDLVRLQKIGLLLMHLTPRKMIVALKMFGPLNIFLVFMHLVGSVLRRREVVKPSQIDPVAH
jgi:anaerobic magnesium-protoporphyrin IX monomethyl ester cyclase